MNSTPVISQEWSLHAELTFLHQQPSSNCPVPIDSQRLDKDGVHMEYSWNNQPQPSTSTAPSTSFSTTSSNALHPCYGFQRGNILFTTSPPSRCAYVEPKHQSFPVDLQHQVQSTAGTYGSLPNRKSQPQYNRRCKSTCSIVLSGSHSPIPSEKCSKAVSSSSQKYTCGSPQCYCSSRLGSFLPLQENCEVCDGGRSPTSARRAARANTFTTHFCTHVPERTGPLNKDLSKEAHDVASQTEDNWHLTTPSVHSKGSTAERRKSEMDLLQLPAAQIIEPSPNKPGKRLARSPARLRGKSPLLQGRRSQGSQCSIPQRKSSNPDTGQRKSRTVHIDVYCTGSEEAEASATSDTETDDGDSWSSPQTVLECEQLRVVHTRAGGNQLPQALQGSQTSKKDASPSRLSESFKCDSTNAVKEEYVKRGYDSDDGLSSQYTSKQSSSATLRTEESTVTSKTGQTSRDPSWSTISSSSYAFSDEYDSAAATSSKDTVTEMESSMPSSISLAQSDSFEYADAMDRLRIREKERAWAGEGGNRKTWRSPHAERNFLLQQQKFKDFLQKHLGKPAFPLWKPESHIDSEDDDDEDEDETGYAWSFSGEEVPQRSGIVKRESTVRKAVTSLTNPDIQKVSEGTHSKSFDSEAPLTHRLSHHFNRGLRSKSPSPPLSKLQSTITLPFTTLFGKKTDQLSKAQKFGTIVPAFRKPGHHIGPSKNPECLCEHCLKYYEDTVYRSRASSLGDMSLQKKKSYKGSSEHALDKNSERDNNDNA